MASLPSIGALKYYYKPTIVPSDITIIVKLTKIDVRYKHHWIMLRKEKDSSFLLMDPAYHSAVLVNK
jgi:hypothetical protein